MRNLLVTALVIAAITVSAHATASIKAQIYTVTDLPADSLVAFVADIAGDGYGDHAANPLGPDGFVVDTDDDIFLGIGTSSAAAGYIVGTYVLDTTANPTAQGKQVAAIWFHTPYSAGATGAGEGVTYGVLADLAPVPNEGQTKPDSGFYTETGTFSSPYTTTPEPATMAVLLVGGGLMAIRRRNRRSA